jgi:hypothetical protein
MPLFTGDSELQQLLHIFRLGQIIETLTLIFYAVLDLIG